MDPEAAAMDAEPARHRFPNTFPPEIWLNILHHMDYYSALKLSETGRFFHLIVHSEPYASSPARRRFVLEAETYRRNQYWAGDRFACSQCLGVLPRHAFSRNMTGRRRHRQRGGADAASRVCVDCAMRAGLYRKAVPLNLGLGAADQRVPMIVGRCGACCALGVFEADCMERDRCLRCCGPAVGDLLPRARAREEERDEEARRRAE